MSKMKERKRYFGEANDKESLRPAALANSRQGALPFCFPAMRQHEIERGRQVEAARRRLEGHAWFLSRDS
jgi:hypothetical protein